MNMRRVARLVSSIAILIVLSSLLSIVSSPSALQAQTDQTCFPETGYCMSGRIREFWQQNGGLRVFGYPITPQQQEIIEGQPFQVQTFERHRLELHPENARPYDVLLGRMGVDRLVQQGNDWNEFPRAAPQAGCRYFAQTGHNICGDFLTAWRASGLEFDGQSGTSEAENLALFGLPLSEPRNEFLSDGQNHTVQWFERARFESHPANPPPYHVLFGLLAKEYRDALVPAQTGGTVTADSTILAAPRATAEQAAAYIIDRGTTYSDYSVRLIVSYYWNIAPQVGVDPLIAIAQNIHETDNLKSWWSQRPRRNPAGLGVTGETSKNPPPDYERHLWAYNEEEQLWRKGLSFADWEIATRAHIGRLLAYAIRDDQANAAQRALINEALALRPLPGSFRGVAPTMRGLNGRWAVPGTTYADKIAKFANAIREK